MTCYRPTTLKLASAHCPRAIDFYEEKRPAFREHFAQGIAAHDCLAGIGAQSSFLGRPPTLDEMIKTCDDNVRALITTGRSFEGEREPPMPAEDAFAGKVLALNYATSEDTEWLSSDVWHERGLGFDTQWRPVQYDSSARRFRLILDQMAIVEDGGEDYSGRLALVRDYKSAWSTDQSELETYQMKGQAVAASLVLQDIDGVRREVVNLRTGQVFREDLWLESGGREQLADWRAEISAYMGALDAMRDKDGRRPVRPGAGCLSCPWAISCEAAHPLAPSEQGMAERLAKIDGERAALIVALKSACSERPVILADGAVGWQKTEHPEPTTSAAYQMWAEWSGKAGDLPGFLTALKPGMASLSSVAKKLYKNDKAEQARCLSEWTQLKSGREFGVRKFVPPGMQPGKGQ